MIIISIFAGLIGLSFIILIHELGHLIAARSMGIDVEVFSVGFGYILFRFSIGKTEYRLSLIPFGGYCRMKDSSSIFAASSNQGLKQQDGSFYSAKPIKRIITSLAGPFANLVFSFLVFTVISLIGKEVQFFDNKIVLYKDIFPEQASVSQPAIKAGLQTGDRITAIENVPIDSFSDISEHISNAPGKDLSIRILRDGSSRTLSIHPATSEETGMGQIGVFPWIDANILSIVDGSTADAAGLLPNDTIVQINNVDVAHAWGALSEIRKGAPQTVTIKVRRNNSDVYIRMVPPAKVDDFEKIGIYFQQKFYMQKDSNILTAFGSASREIAMLLTASVEGIMTIVQGANISQLFAGPIRITYFTGQLLSDSNISSSLASRILNYIHFLGIISIAILFMNLLPIPVTDGGQTLLFFYELITRKMPSRKFIFFYYITGSVLILLLIIIVLWGDFAFLLGRT